MNRLALRRISSRSIAYERSEGFPDVETDHQFGGAAHRVFRHRLSERDRRGLHRLVADGAVGGIAGLFETRFYPRKIIGMSTADAAGIGGIAMQFDDVVG